MPMMILYPDIKPYTTYYIDVEPPHRLYVEECGNPDGIPVLFLHGGPGAGIDKQCRRFFDPEKYRIILYDQRGAGHSTPHAELKNNHTAALVDDIEALRQYLDIPRWLLFGGSWGATLALLYTQAHTSAVLGLILRGVFLCREKDLQWFYQDGASRLFPDYWEDYLHPIAPERRDDLISAYYDVMTGDNELARMGAAKAWSLWEAHCATLRPNCNLVEHFSDPHRAVAMALIEAHFFKNKGFLEPGQVLEQADRLAGIPGIIVHGRYDAICPLENAFELHRVWYDSELHIVRDAGHSAFEPSIVDALIRATRQMAKRFEDELL